MTKRRRRAGASDPGEPIKIAQGANWSDLAQGLGLEPDQLRNMVRAGTTTVLRRTTQLTAIELLGSDSTSDSAAGDQDSRTDGIPLRVAAQRLGLKVNTLEQRCRRGRVDSYLGADRRRYVVMPELQEASDDANYGVRPDSASGITPNSHLHSDASVRQSGAVDRRGDWPRWLHWIAWISARIVRLLEQLAASHGVSSRRTR